MIAIISKTTADADMPVILELIEPSLYSGNRRVSISKTLDQGASFSDMGFSVADRRYQIKAIVSETVAASLKTLNENNTELTLALWEGLFKVTPMSLKIKGTGIAVFTFAIKSQISA